MHDIPERLQHIGGNVKMHLILTDKDYVGGRIRIVAAGDSLGLLAGV